MRYPVFDLPWLGGGTLIAAVAVLHVYIAHFAVGAGIFFAVAETIGRRRRDALLLRFLRDFSRFFIYLAFVLGAVSGVGIWFCISMVSPRATSLLIHQFVWGWATEWVLFLVEIVAGYVYYYTWDRLDARRHLIVAWIYAVAAWLSLAVINGIITFMLTPGRWAELRAAGDWDAAFWAGFFNPTYWPSLVLRTISSLALAGILVCVAVNLARGYGREERIRVIHAASYFMLPLVLMAPVGWWYFRHVPADARGLPFGGAVAMSLLFAFAAACSVLIAVYAWFALLRARGYVGLPTALLLAALAFMATGAVEYVREGIRKPYLVRGYLWSNGIADRPAEVARLRTEGILASAPWIAPPERMAGADLRTRGGWVFQAQCSQCHTIDGVNGVRPLVHRWPPELIRMGLDHLDRLKGFMPPFVGTEAEKQALTDWLVGLNPG